ncbi:MAG: hypothetical protein R3F27_03540 [Gammaproteobacteria bacterium]|nr:hypothetical protein [Gammaproteobacteria bacterium]
MKRKPDFALLMVVLLSLLTVAPQAQAYLDPSTGSMILSAIIGVFATLALAIKTWWYKLKSLFRGGHDRKQGDPGDAVKPASGDDGARRG